MGWEQWFTFWCPPDETLTPLGIDRAGTGLPDAAGSLPSSETSDAAVCQEVSLLVRRPIFDIMLSLSLYSPKKGLSCFSRPDNYFSLIPACQGQSQPSIEAGDRTTSHHLSPSPFFSISLPLSVSLCLTLWLQDPPPVPPPSTPQSVVVSLSLSSSVSSLRIDLHWENSDSVGQEWLSEE